MGENKQEKSKMNEWVWKEFEGRARLGGQWISEDDGRASWGSSDLNSYPNPSHPNKPVDGGVPLWASVSPL